MFLRSFLLTVLSLLVSANLSQGAAPGTYEILTLGGTNGPGVRPYSGVVLGRDGNYYGTTSQGGAYGGGAVFKLTSDGVLTTLVSFNYDDGNPRAGLIVGTDGNFYGTTQGNPLLGEGNAHSTIFRLNLAGKLTTLASFPDGDGVPIVAPQKLLQGTDGNFYGTTQGGGSQQKGSVFRMTIDGAVTPLVSFTGANGMSPSAGLVEGGDGNFYGTTFFGGANNSDGTVFRVTPGGMLTTLASFGPGDAGLFPAAELTRGPDGNLYGVTSGGGKNFGGAVFKVTPDGTVTAVVALPSSNTLSPGPLVLGDDGNFYGTTVDNYYRVSLAGELSVLADFNSTFDGRLAEGPLLKIGNGQFLGTTYGGGSTGLNDLGTIQRLTEQGTVTPVTFFPPLLGGGFNSELSEGSGGRLYGTFADDGNRKPGAFNLTTSGTVTVLRSFRTSKPVGSSSRLVQTQNGDLYGTIQNGGVLSPPSAGRTPSGFIYRIKADGSIATVYQFVASTDLSTDAHGTFPVGGLTLGPESELYGTTSGGGANGRGTFFKVDATGTLTTLASFDSSTGFGPTGDLIFTGGSFYGLTSFGGDNNTGTFFTATSGGAITAIASLPANGKATGRLILARNGNFYGATFAGGANNLGSIFRITKTGAVSTFASFDSNTGSGPRGVIEAIDGNFYGVTTSGTVDQAGSIFRIDSNGAVAALFHFNKAQGLSPFANLIQASDGNLYGTTAGGGPSRNGVVYRLTILPPGQLLNISIRMRVLTGDKVLIGGFIITGVDPKKVIIRGIGPSLGSLGISGVLADPTLELHQGNTTLVTNDNWKMRSDGSSQQAEVEATTIPPTNDLESAIVATLDPGAYTAVLAGKNQGIGVGVVEVYDLAQGAGSKPANISSRGFVDTGDNVMIGGLIVGGPGGGSAKVIVRAIGPSLSGSGVAGALQDPTLEIHDGSGTLLVFNDNWKIRSDGSSQQAEIEATTIPPNNDLESAVVAALPPGNYTAIVRGKNNGTGVGLVEVYNLP
jgi:uncharacterized repeat protein (TIGR03803 family)